MLWVCTMHNAHAYVIIGRMDQWTILLRFFYDWCFCIQFNCQKLYLICARKQNDKRNKNPSILDFAYICSMYGTTPIVKINHKQMRAFLRMGALSRSDWFLQAKPCQSDEIINQTKRYKSSDKTPVQIFKVFFIFAKLKIGFLKSHKVNLCNTSSGTQRMNSCAQIQLSFSECMGHFNLWYICVMKNLENRFQ